MKKITSRIVAWVLIVALCASTILATDYTVGTPDEFYAALEASLGAQESVFTITMDGDSDDLTTEKFNLANLQRELAARGQADNPTGYIALNIGGGTISNLENKYVFSSMSYISTPEELEYVSSQAKEIVASLDLESMDDFLKIKTIYAYMTSNFVYDSEISNFSAYSGLTEGTMVCQGYALLTSHLMEEAGINCRLITGQSRDQAHAWNLVELGGQWYWLDTTWDATKTIGEEGNWDYFLKSTEDFTGHELFAQFSSDDFLGRHPLAETSYPLTQLTLETKGDYVAGLIMRVGVSTSVELTLPEEYQDLEVIWSTGDEEVLTVEDGKLTANSIGVTWVSASCPDHPEWIDAKIQVTTVDMESVSDWAKETVTEFYLNQLLPSYLCGDYQTGLTRVEFALLLEQFVYQTVGLPSMNVVNNFDDISDLSAGEMYAILRCKSMGILNGNGDGTFSPHQVVTRQEAAAILVRLSNFLNDYEAKSTVDDLFLDESLIADWALKEVALCQELGFLQGDEDGNFRPEDPMTREEIYVAMSRVYDSIEDLLAELSEE